MPSQALLSLAAARKVRRAWAGDIGICDERADFAIPSATVPSILIEVKACGATGSKEADVLGDIHRGAGLAGDVQV